MMQSEKQCRQVEMMMPEEIRGFLNDITTKEDSAVAMMESCGGTSFLKRSALLLT